MVAILPEVHQCSPLLLVLVFNFNGHIAQISTRVMGSQKEEVFTWLRSLTAEPRANNAIRTGHLEA
jgi:hypothetical protein